MKEDVADRLRLATDERAAITAQRAIRGHVARKRYQVLKEEEERKRREAEEKRRQEAMERERRAKEKEREEARKKEMEARERREAEQKKRPKAAPVVPIDVATNVSRPAA